MAGISSSTSSNNISRVDNNTNNNSVSNTQKSTTATKSLAGLSVSVANPPQDRPTNIQGQQNNLAVNSAAKVGGVSTAASAKASASIPDTAYDGKYVGANGQVANNISDVQAVKPNNGIAQTGKNVVYVNGIQTDLAAQQKTLQAIANQTGANVIGIHNSTEGFAKDIAQSALDKAHLGTDPAVDTLSNAIYNAAKSGEQLNVIAHSQGGIITSRAVGDAINRLREDGLSSQAAKDLLSKSVNIQTFGGAALNYPDGPNYRHVVNNADPVPDLLGKGLSGRFDKNTEFFTDNRAGLNPLKVFDNHSMDNVYLSHINENLFK